MGCCQFAVCAFHLLVVQFYLACLLQPQPQCEGAGQSSHFPFIALL